MNSVLAKLYRYFYRMNKDNKLTDRIKTNHQILIKRLNKQNRRIVLRIIDDMDQICETVSMDSFNQGF
jgi:hypothetical protein